jgi:hypothetical protein
MGASDRHARAFVYRGGVRIAGTVLSCDASVGSDLVFLSHAPVFEARGRRIRVSPAGGRRRLLATELTLALLGSGSSGGARRRESALTVVPGRPFSLGGLRLEVFGSGFMPGAASLSCEHDGRRVVYGGRLGGGPDVEVRAADALCLDARDAARGVAFPPRDEALATVGRAVREALASGAAPVVVFDALEASPVVAAALAADRIGLRAHRAIALGVSAFRHAGVDVPVPGRFAGRMGPGEVLLWPARERLPARRSGGRALRFIPVSPMSADFDALLRYVKATGASEVAMVNAPGDDLPRALRELGIDAYVIGPPRQTDLFAAHAA